MVDYSEEVKRLMRMNMLKNAQVIAEEDLKKDMRRRPQGKVEPLSRASYAKGYEYAEALVKGKIAAEIEAFRYKKVQEIIRDMPKREKRGYAGVKNKALVPKRGQKAGPLED